MILRSYQKCINGMNGTVFEIASTILNPAAIFRSQGFKADSVEEFFDKVNWPPSRRALFQVDNTGEFILISTSYDEETGEELSEPFISDLRWDTSFDKCLTEYIVNEIVNELVAKYEMYAESYIWPEFKIETREGITIRAEGDYQIRLSDGKDRNFLINKNNLVNLNRILYREFELHEIMKWVYVQNDYVFNPEEKPNMMLMGINAKENGIIVREILKREYLLDSLYKQEKEYNELYYQCLKLLKDNQDEYSFSETKSYLNLQDGRLKVRPVARFEDIRYTWMELPINYVEEYPVDMKGLSMSIPNPMNFEDFINEVNLFYDYVESNQAVVTSK